MDNVNPYHPGIVLKNFPEIYNKLKSDSCVDLLLDTFIDKDITPRFAYTHSIVFKDIFYYIDLLYDHNPKTVIDVGCGECEWKNWFPGIIGFDPMPATTYSKYDFIDYFDEEFSRGHTENYDCGMGLNSVHDVPWDKLEKQIHLAMNIVKDRFLFTFNFSIINHNSENKFTKMDDNINYLDAILHKMPYNIVMLDYPTHRNKNETTSTRSYINGDVRFILEKGTI